MTCVAKQIHIPLVLHSLPRMIRSLWLWAIWYITVSSIFIFLVFFSFAIAFFVAFHTQNSIARTYILVKAFEKVDV